MTRNMAELFALPKTIEPDELASRDEFNLLAVEGEEQRYKGFIAKPQGPVMGPLHWYKMRRAVAAWPLSETRDAHSDPDRRISDE